jgi:hypothetical protein
MPEGAPVANCPSLFKIPEAAQVAVSPPVAMVQGGGGALREEGDGGGEHWKASRIAGLAVG